MMEMVFCSICGEQQGFISPDRWCFDSQREAGHKCGQHTRLMRLHAHGDVKFSKAASAVCRSMISGLMSSPETEIVGIVMGLCTAVTVSFLYVSSDTGRGSLSILLVSS